MNAHPMTGDRRTPRGPLKGITKVRPDFTVVETWVIESTFTKLVIEWRTRSAGMGLLSFETREGHVIRCGQLDEDVVRRVLSKTIEGLTSEQFPALLNANGGVEGLIATSQPLAVSSP